MKLNFVAKVNFKIINFLFIIWISSLKAREIDSPIRDPPCYFNPLCTCSKAVPDLGIVRCEDTLLCRIPQTINISKAFMLHLNNVGLRTLQPYFLQATGLYKLSITNNPLTVIPDDSFVGLERTLWRLDLSHNNLLNVPSKALRYLQKLRYLDLSGNDITRIFPDSWKGLENSLETLILSENSIAHLSPDTFSGLPLLDTINLKGNNLREIDASVFRDGMGRLAHIILADNQLTSIPYIALSPLKMLKTLDLSFNRITKMFPTLESGSINIQLDVRMSLDVLDLGFNQITILESQAFQYFANLNKTILDGNPIGDLEENAFRQAKIQEISLRDCDLTEVDPEAFAGLEDCLEKLDLSGNNITGLHDDFLMRLEDLKSISLSDNLLQKFGLPDTGNGFKKSLFKLDLSGNRNNPINLDNFNRFKHLRALHLSRLTQDSLEMNDFREFGADLERLSITFARLKTIKNRAFENVHSLKYLDLSENSLGQIEKEAFLDIGHTLVTLTLSHGLSQSLNTVPYEPLRVLTNLRELDLSNNKIINVPDTSFHFLKKLKTVELQDNEIGQIFKGTFQEDIHPHLETIYLSFNKLKSIKQQTFTDLPLLEQIHLDDNQISILERRSFMNLENLKRLNLKGNQINSIPYETFQNLPELEDLDISYNQLTEFQFSVLDQVGTLSSFRLNISHNSVQDLTPNLNYNSESGKCFFTSNEDFHSNIRIFDISHNNITQIGKQYFKPLEQSLTHLYLSHNFILNATNDVFGNMYHLQWLDLSFNRILEFDYDTFKYTKNLQAIFLSHNLIGELPKDIFRSLFNLRLVDLSYNRLRFLPDNIFREDGLERLDLSNNQLTRLPLSSFSSGSAATLTEMDLSYNSITTVTHGEMFSKLDSLTFLDLSHNRLVQIDIGVFALMPKVTWLDLSFNFQLSLDRYGKTFQGIENKLLYLNLENLTMSVTPDLPLPSLTSLSLAHNSISTIPTELVGNLTMLRSLNLAHNQLAIVPIVTHSLVHLERLFLQDNPILVLTNTSLLGVSNHLEELDISDLSLHTFETDALYKINYLRKLKIGVYKNVKMFNIPKLIEHNYGLESLVVDVEKDTPLNQEMYGELPPKLRSITITGRTLTKLNLNFLKFVESPTLHFSLINTSISQLSFEELDNSQFLRNLTLTIEDNPNLQNLENPISGEKPGLSSKTFLIDLNIKNNKWNCDCSIGWIEVWQRKRRQYICDSSLSVLPPFRSQEYSCRHVDDDVRTSTCANRANDSLVEVLKNEIECGWSSASSNNGFAITFILIIVRVLGIL